MTIIILGTDGMKCLSTIALKGDYDNVDVFGNDYNTKDICIVYDYIDGEYVYKFYSSKEDASCDRLALAMGGVGINKGCGIAAKKDNFLNTETLPVIEINTPVSDMWDYHPLRDTSNLPSYTLRVR